MIHPALQMTRGRLSERGIRTIVSGVRPALARPRQNTSAVSEVGAQARMRPSGFAFIAYICRINGQQAWGGGGGQREKGWIPLSVEVNLCGK